LFLTGWKLVLWRGQKNLSKNSETNKKAICTESQQLSGTSMATKSCLSTSAKSLLPLLMRDEYGALQMSSHLQPAQIVEVKNLLKKAANQEAGIPKEYSSYSKSDFECLNHDVYDV